MAKKSKIEVKESVEKLTSLYKKEQNHRIKSRIKLLICFKEERFKNQEALSDYIGLDYSTVKRLLKQYNDEGLDSFLKIKSGGNRPSVISEEAHAKLQEKLNDSINPFKGYWEVLEWLEITYNKKFTYNTVRTYLKRHFKTKIKTPRKSHYKKNEQAIEAFFKTANSTKVI